MFLPQVIILSTQRSGTHLLQSFLSRHPMINGRGEMFLRYMRTGNLDSNLDGRINVGILMYSEIAVFLKMVESLDNDLDLKIIHLLRDPGNVALSRLQMEADKKMLGSSYQAHFHTTEQEDNYKKFINARKALDSSRLDVITKQVTHDQYQFTEMLKDTPHLQLYYEEIAPDNKPVEQLNKATRNKLFNFLGLDAGDLTFYTTYIKTGIHHN